jgi:two-component system, OmpR family, response regulator
MRILLAEDEAAIRDHVGAALEGAGYIVTACANGPDAWEAGGTEHFDAIVLDLGLPGLDGLTLLKRWRAEGVATPVIVLTARGSWMERVDGFDSGADDYLPKPFRTEELLARLRALLRRAGSTQAQTIVRSAGGLALDLRARQVRIDGRDIAVTPAEFRALERLARNPGETVSHADLSHAVQGEESDASRNAMEVLINRLRRKLGADAIATRRGFGYYIPADEP